MNKKYFLILFFLFPVIAQAVIISGRVTDSGIKPLVFANVFIKGTTHGTNTNDDGFYILDVQPGRHEIVFKYLGYKTVMVPVFAAQEKITLDVNLEIENYQLAEVVIKANTEDPAYEIIRRAQKKRKYYLDQVRSFSCDAYIKGTQKLKKYPKKILGQEINLDGIIDTATGIVYLSESVSKFHFKKPDLSKEEMISSKVSGDNRAFSFNQNGMMQYNFYNNLVGIGGLTDRGFVSPVASSAMLYYTYKLIGSFNENNQTVNKIEVKPIRLSDPAFSGYIYIIDSTWRIHSLDLFITKESQLQFVDTLFLEQVYLPVDSGNTIWMPVSGKFNFSFNLLGFKGNGTFIGVNSNFKINPEFDRNFFNGEVLKINKDANKKDLNYWMNQRPVPLTKEETVDYVKKDSLEIIRESEPYQDSLDRRSNKIKIMKILITGYTYKKSRERIELSFSPLINNLEYNTVEGLRIGLSAEFKKSYENKKGWSISPQVAYGFANETVQASGKFKINYDPHRLASVTIEGGQDAVQYNNQKPIPPIVNSAYTLLAERNYMKLYEKKFISLQHKTEITNGLNITTDMEYSDRLPMVNNSDYTLIDLESKKFLSNNPNFPSDSLNLPPFERNQSFSVQLQFRIRFRQEYISRPNNKFILGSKYPTLILGYKRAFENLFGSDMDYDFVFAGVEDQVRLGMIGTISYNLGYGNFVGVRDIKFVSYQHFRGNLTLVSNFRLNSYNLLAYYLYSTEKEFFEGHIEHDFSGFILNKIPFIRELNLNEVVGFHYLYVRDKPMHYEYSIGLQKFGIARVDFVSAIASNTKPLYGFRIGVSIFRNRN